MQKPPSMSHTLTVLSALQVARRADVESTAMSATGALWPLKVVRALPVAIDHDFSWRLREAVKRWRPSGLKARAVMGSESYIKSSGWWLEESSDGKE